MKTAWDNLEVYARKLFIFINRHLRFCFWEFKRGKAVEKVSVLEDFKTVLNNPDASRSLVGKDDFDEVLENQRSVENWRKGDPSKVVKNLVQWCSCCTDLCKVELARKEMEHLANFLTIFNYQYWLIAVCMFMCALHPGRYMEMRG